MSSAQSQPNVAPLIAIVGGGLAGLTLSIGLSRHNITHKIYESALAFSEIGAGIALGPNSVRALELIDPAITVGFNKCVTYNEGVGTDEHGNGIGEGRNEWLDIRVGMADGFHDLITTVTHTGCTKPGRACFHRAKFLDELIKLIPPSTTQFGKTLQSIETAKDQEEPLALRFADGTTATASAVIACDGIKSGVRKSYILGDDADSHQPAGRPQFTQEYAYRGMYTRDQFIDLTKGSISPGKGTLFCGDHGYVVMYPVEKGQFVNMVAVKRVHDSDHIGIGAGEPVTSTDKAKAFVPPDENDSNWVQPVDPDTAVADFSDWGEPIRTLLSQIRRPERWALYDHLPAPTYVKGRVVILGDSAHASTPHQGQGAGMAFEDALVLSGILGKMLENGCGGHKSEATATTTTKIEACFRAYDAVRRPRTQELCRTSREMGEMVEFVLPGIGSDLAKMKANLDIRMKWIWDLDLQAEVQRGVDIAKDILTHDPTGP
ncbi:hypothetical protein A1O3_07811 [Capronia epimyces CBS 606.96]|uniref:FAD-binding domain-containing protein n=1 Tax=Capronia epimyces CBS 606.96 TaxID=1182542 RepID=W9XG97_9EURO|nr:uncharacterized protein A1O3_07811 [Capronia epimyces CBS 606.96]EXJ79532.1 hypothetical protein A1O3_07811 [Capronia epimyces CBS 606.96]